MRRSRAHIEKFYFDLPFAVINIQLNWVADSLPILHSHFLIYSSRHIIQIIYNRMSFDAYGERSVSAEERRRRKKKLCRPQPSPWGSNSRSSAQFIIHFCVSALFSFSSHMKCGLIVTKYLYLLLNGCVLLFVQHSLQKNKIWNFWERQYELWIFHISSWCFDDWKIRKTKKNLKIVDWSWSAQF